MPLDGRPGELDQASAAVAVAEYSAVVSELVELAEAPADDTERRCPPAGRRSRRPPTGPRQPARGPGGQTPKIASAGRDCGSAGAVAGLGGARPLGGSTLAGAHPATAGPR